MRFRVELQAGAGVVELEAMDEAAALAQAEARGARVLRLTALDAQADQVLMPKRFPLNLFCQELLSLLDAGLSLPEALPVLVAKEPQTGVRAMLAHVLQLLRDGQSFSEALARYPACFPDLFLAGIRAAETTSGLSEALQRFLDYQLQFDLIRKKLVSASIYPAMLLCVGGAVALFLIGYVVPRFSVVFESSGHEVPLVSRILLDMGAWLYDHWQPALLGFLGVVVGSAVALMQPAFRQRLLLLVLRLPVLREPSSIFFLSRFYRALSLLLHSGLPLVKALGLARGLLNVDQQQRLDQAIRLVQEGQPFSAAMGRYGLTTVVADSLLAVGERSGRLDDMLERCARFHDEALGRQVDVASRLLEPVLMTIIGVAVGVIVVLMYMPIFDLAGSIE